MLNILSLKKKQQSEKSGGKTKTTAAQLRIQKGITLAISFVDLQELDALPKSIKITFPDANDVFNFDILISPDDGALFVLE